jgi:hypothetical protein
MSEGVSVAGAVDARRLDWLCDPASGDSITARRSSFGSLGMIGAPAPGEGVERLRDQQAADKKPAVSDG